MMTILREKQKRTPRKTKRYRSEVLWVWQYERGTKSCHRGSEGQPTERPEGGSEIQNQRKSSHRAEQEQYTHPNFTYYRQLDSFWYLHSNEQHPKVNVSQFTKLSRVWFILNKNSKYISEPMNTKLFTCVWLRTYLLTMNQVHSLKTC